jgi:hypothetical protein
LPFEEYVMVKDLLNQVPDAEKLSLMEQAVNDARFMADLESALSEFRHVDAEWWEHNA